jgi:hypothetical protein
VRAAQLRPNPRNWRIHPAPQREALSGVLDEIGYAGALLARELPDGSLELIDGHLRAEITPEMEVPVLVLDLTEQEAATLLTLYDPLAALAETHHERFAQLAAEVDTRHAAIRQMLDELVAAGTKALDADSSVEPSQSPSPTFEGSYQVLVHCRDEAEQQAVFERLRAEGYECRVLVI